MSDTVFGHTPVGAMCAMIAARICGVKNRVYYRHGVIYTTMSGLKYHIFRLEEKFVAALSTAVVNVSHSLSRLAVRDGLNTASKNNVIGHGTCGGIDVNYFTRNAIIGAPDKRAELGISKNAFVFSFVVRIVKDKGINELVAAFDKLSQEYHVSLILVYSQERDLDPIEMKTEEMIKDNNHIHAVGRQSDVRPYLAASDAFVLPSYREGVGLVLLEANAMDVPCIASDIIGCNDVVTVDVNDELVQPRNVESLYQKMKEWVEHREQVAEKAKVCRNYVLSHYAHEDVKRAYYEELKSLVGIED